MHLPPLPRILRLLAWVCLGVSGLRAQLPLLPPLTGSLSGDVATSLAPEAPPLHWTATIDGVGPQGIDASMVATAPGVRLVLRVHHHLDGSTDWELTEGTLDLEQCLPLLAARPEFAALADFAMTGTLALAGRGAWRDAQLTGEATATLRDGTLRHAPSGVEASGIALELHLTSLLPLRAEAPQTFTFAEAHLGPLSARNGRLNFTMAQPGEISVSVAGLDVLGGKIDLDPFQFSLAKMTFDAQARFRGLQLAEAVPLLPSLLATAEGSLSGRLALHWSHHEGPSIGDGRLRVDKGHAPVIKLAAQPGLFTARVPQRFKILPSWTGPLVKILSINNPSYPALKDIELGSTPLQVDSLRLRMQPQGDTQGRTLRLTLVAHPTRSNLVSKVTFDVNVLGPLQDVMQATMKQHSSAAFHLN